MFISRDRSRQRSFNPFILSQRLISTNGSPRNIVDFISKVDVCSGNVVDFIGK